MIRKNDKAFQNIVFLYNVKQIILIEMTTQHKNNKNDCI